MSKKVLATSRATTLREMIEALQEMEKDAKFEFPAIDAEAVYVTINSDSIKMSLVQETLTDGSKVYNIEMDSVSPRGWK